MKTMIVMAKKKKYHNYVILRDYYALTTLLREIRVNIHDVWYICLYVHFRVVTEVTKAK